MPLRSPEWYRAHLDFTTANLRHRWASAEAKSGGLTPTLARFIEETAKECRTQSARLMKLKPVKRPRQS